MDELTLANGVRMPQEGFGVFQIPDHEEAKRVVRDALACGYRLVDTAAAYLNEHAVGEAIRESGLRREEVFVETILVIDPLRPTEYTPRPTATLSTTSTSMSMTLR